jgi:hypothetical protein
LTNAVDHTRRVGRGDTEIDADDAGFHGFLLGLVMVDHRPPSSHLDHGSKESQESVTAPTHVLQPGPGSSRTHVSIRVLRGRTGGANTLPGRRLSGVPGDSYAAPSRTSRGPHATPSPRADQALWCLHVTQIVVVSRGSGLGLALCVSGLVPCCEICRPRPTANAHQPVERT